MEPLGKNNNMIFSNFSFKFTMEHNAELQPNMEIAFFFLSYPSFQIGSFTGSKLKKQLSCFYLL